MIVVDSKKELRLAAANYPDKKVEWNAPQSDTLVISKPHVMRSAAGFYIGCLCIEIDEGYVTPQPYSRESGYFPTKEVAEQRLQEH